VLDISEQGASDLLTRTQSLMKQEPHLHFEFTQQDCALLNELDAGKSIILKGNFSASLADSLAGLLLARYGKEAVKGRLILISEQGEKLQYYPDITTHQVTAEEKQSLVKLSNPQDIDWSKPLATLLAERDFAGSSDGLKTLKRAIKPLEPFNPDKSEDYAKAFFRARRKQIMGMLRKSPYVYIAGLSGVGKTTFVAEELLEEYGANLYTGEKNIEAWAKDKTDTLKVLFIDEENLSGRQWSEFEGLFNDPPGLVVNGKYRELDKNHKVIFAGNPASYGDERKLSPLFTRHQRAVVFDPLPLSVIYENILKPVFTGKSLTHETTDICKPILDIYKLNELLLLRESRRKTATTDAQRYGGLGGADFEGEPAAGKSEAITYMLLLHGYREIKIEPGKGPDEMPLQADMDKVFYRIPAKMSLADKEKWLLHIFNTGLIAVIDEINSAPMMERLLNSLLMGKTPENKPPTHPGFMIFSTKNPLTMDGRRAPSTAFSRRFYNRVLPPYPRSEIRSILQKDVHRADTLLRQELEYLTNAYLFNVKLAETNHYSPSPTFREVERIALGIKLHPPIEEYQEFIASNDTEILPVDETLSSSRDTLFQTNDTEKYLSAVKDVLRHYKEQDMGSGAGKVRCRSLLALLESKTVDDNWKILAIAGMINTAIPAAIRGENLVGFLYNRLGINGRNYIEKIAMPKAADAIAIATPKQLLKVETALLEQAKSGKYELYHPLQNEHVLPAKFTLEEEKSFFQRYF